MRTSQRKGRMARPRYQDGSLFSVETQQSLGRTLEGRLDQGRRNALHRTQRTVVLGSVSDLSRREARSLLTEASQSDINQGRHRARPIMTFEKFAKEHWQAGALLALKPGSANYYNFQLDKHVIPALGAYRFCDLNRPIVQHSSLNANGRGTQAPLSMASAPRWLRCCKRRWNTATLKSTPQGRFK